jgi:hypothetical protein
MVPLLKIKEVSGMSVIYHQELSNNLLGLAFTVHNGIGPGLLESAYEEAFCVELAYAGLAFELPPVPRACRLEIKTTDVRQRKKISERILTADSADEEKRKKI